MKRANETEVDRMIQQAERTLALLRRQGVEAVRRAKDWATPLSSSTGPGPKNSVSDPTGNAATADDDLREQWTLLSVELGQWFDTNVALESRVSRLTRDAVVENERAGIGWCECGRYCDGADSNRLRSLQCPACSAKTYRQKTA